MKFFEDDLPLGLWTVKWIDRFHFLSGSAHLDAALEKLPVESISALKSLNQKQIAEMLGTRPVGKEPIAPEPPPVICRRFLAGSLPLLHVGNVFQSTPDGTIAAGSLQGATRTVRISSHITIDDLRVASTIAAPEEWTVNKPFKVLNRFEYRLSGIAGIEESRCLLFRHGTTEYVLPKIVIFRAFYGWSSRLINALCNGPWPDSAKKLISVISYNSGLVTGIDTESGDWKIVLQPGFSENDAPRLALLWFDEYARKQTEALYSNALRESRALGGPFRGSWFASANIPHPLGPEPFTMNVSGFILRSLRVSGTVGGLERFLITGITGSSWPQPNRVTWWELHNSNAQGDEQYPAGEGAEYRAGKPPIEGDPNASAVVGEEADASTSVNLFQSVAFEYLNPPKLERQHKHKSVTGLISRPSWSEGAAYKVSTGNVTYADVAPARADVQSSARSGSMQFEMLSSALTELEKSKKISSFEPIMPPSGSNITVVRNGLPCWSLLKELDRQKGVIPKFGWEVIHQRDANVAKSKRYPRYARCILILSIRMVDRRLILIEIEPRTNDDTSCMVVFESDRPLSEIIVQPALDSIRAHKGVFEKSELQSVFDSLTANKVSSFRHTYVYKQEKGNENRQSKPSGIRSDLLERAFRRVLSL